MAANFDLVCCVGREKEEKEKEKKKKELEPKILR
jgi:triosephosphate isomerase